MTADFERVRELFLAAVGLDPEAQSALLDAECVDQPEIREQVEALLPFDERPADGLEPLSGRRPETIGPYRVPDVLGSGGMGIVYLAEQSVPRRTVALKVLRPGLVGAKTMARFTREAEILGRLCEFSRRERSLPKGPLRKHRCAKLRDSR